VLRLKNSRRGLAITLDGNALHTLLDPETGGAAAVAEACRNLACVGAEPAGVTNCLNFGNPEKPLVMWQFSRVIEGISEACRVFEIPVTGGNVSFYNDTEGVSIHPTPVLGIVGLIEDVDKIATTPFKAAGHKVVLLGRNREELGASRYLKTVHGLERGAPPRLDLDFEKRVQEVCREAVRSGMVFSAHDCSEGGLAVAAAECALRGALRIGCRLDLEDDIRSDALLFGETFSRILLTVDEDGLARLEQAAGNREVPLAVIGETGGGRLVFRHRGRTLVDLDLERAFEAWKRAIPDWFE
jgi:phosphoribosylformylglycinamidine synthase